MAIIKDIIKTNDRLYRLSSKISDLSEELNIPSFLVGGCVRDLLIDPNIDSVDIDIMVEGNAIDYAEKLANILGVKTIVPFPEFATARIPYDECEIEVASARLESYDSKSRKPKSVDMTDVIGDLKRRDFTVNAIAISLSKDNFGELIDPFDGLQHLKSKILKTPDNECLESLKKNADRIKIVSQERITNELFKILNTPSPSVGLILLEENGLLEYIFPEIHIMYGLDQTSEWHHKDIFFHTMEVVDNAAKLSKKVDLRLAALVHDIGKPKTRRLHKEKGYTFYGHDDLGSRMLEEVSKRMKFSNKTRDYIKKLTALHLRPISLAKKDVTDSAIRRLIVDAGEDIDDLMLLCRADITTKNPNNVKKYLSNFDYVEKRMKEVDEKDELRLFQSPVKGVEIMKMFNLPPGKQVGVIKSLVEEAILDGEIDNSYEAGIKFLNILKKTGKFN